MNRSLGQDREDLCRYRLGSAARLAGRVRGVSLHAARGEIVVVMGASGSGKTTVLRAVAGLDPIAGGSVVIGSLRLEAGRPLRGEHDGSCIARSAWSSSSTTCSST